MKIALIWIQSHANVTFDELVETWAALPGKNRRKTEILIGQCWEVVFRGPKSRCHGQIDNLRSASIEMLHSFRLPETDLPQNDQICYRCRASQRDNLCYFKHFPNNMFQMNSLLYDGHFSFSGRTSCLRPISVGSADFAIFFCIILSTVWGTRNDLISIESIWCNN